MGDETRKLATRIERVDPRSLALLERNARFMRHEQYQQLVDNVKRDGALSSVPFAAKRADGKYEVLSGNHRVQAAIDAGLEQIDVMLTDDPLPDEKRLALQLSHNSIVGEDDPAILAQLYKDIGDIDLKRYSGVDDAVLKQLMETKPASIAEVQMETRSMLILFLPSEAEHLNELFDRAVKMSPGTDELALVAFPEFDRLLEAFSKVEKRCKVQNRAAALRVILDVFQRYAEQVLPPEKEAKQGG